MEILVQVDKFCHQTELTYEWVNAGSLTAGAAAEVGVTAVNTNSTHFITFVDSSSGNENIRVDTDLHTIHQQIL